MGQLCSTTTSTTTCSSFKGLSQQHPSVLALLLLAMQLHWPKSV
jgi:hypothetical protein